MSPGPSPADPRATLIRIASRALTDALRRDFPESADRLAPLLLRQGQLGVWYGLQRMGEGGEFIEFMALSESPLQPGAPSQDESLRLTESFKLHAEIGRAVAALRGRDERLARLSPALYDLVRQKHPDAGVILARTLRMLLYLEALLFRNDTDTASALQKFAARQRQNDPDLDLALRSLTDHIRIKPETDWFTSPALLLVAAVVNSQCEYFHPTFWEAFSAWHARFEFLKQWRDLPVPLVDFLVYLIRFQSAAGQYARGSGHGRFLEQAAELAGRSGGRYKADTLINAVRVLGVLEAAKSRTLPDDDAVVNAGTDLLAWTQPNGFILTAGDWAKAGLGQPAGEPAVRSFPDAKYLADYLTRRGVAEAGRAALTQRAALTPGKMPELIFGGGGGSESTWSYFRGLHLTEADHAKLLGLIAAEARAKFPAADLVGFSLNRAQAQSLRGVWTREGGGWAERRVLAINARDVVNGDAAFGDRFHLRKLTVPDCFNESRTEDVVEVLLRDDISGEARIRPPSDFVPPGGSGAGSPPEPPPGGGPMADDDESAGCLFAHLLRGACGWYGLDTAFLKDRTRRYIPFPLVTRLLRVVHERRPETCAPVALVFDQRDRVAVPVPLGIDAADTPDGEAADLVAHYPSAAALNQGMSRGMQECDIQLGDLSAAEGWAKRIQDGYLKNNYPLLIERYLRIFNTQRAVVRWLGQAPSPAVSRLPLNEVPRALRRHLDAVRVSPPGATPPPDVIVAIDIGGTLVKVKLYTLTGDTPVPHKRLLSLLVPGRPPGSSLTPDRAYARYVAEAVRRHLDAVAGREARVVAVGVAFPAPVRENRVAGTSGILKRFGLSGLVAENTFEDLQRLDFVALLRTEMASWPGSDETTIAMLNDGDAHGLGVWTHRAIRAGGDAARHRLVVIKLGTGTAGAVFVGGHLVPGLAEWGKMLLDLGARRLADPDLDSRAFPVGIANHYLSTNTLPNLVRARRPDWFTVHTFDSSELGGFLDLHAAGYSRTRFDELLVSWGLKDYAAQVQWPADLGVTAATLRQVMANDDTLAPETRTSICEILGDDATRRLAGTAWVYGALRLRDMLHLNPDGVLGLRGNDDPLPADLVAALREVHDVVAAAADVMGDYLGDFVVLLHDLYQMDRVVVGGGVLSAQTGVRIRTRARDRAAAYRLWLTLDGDELVVEASPREARVVQDSPHLDQPDFGTLGAAAFAAGEHLREIRQKGLNEVRARVLALRPGARVVVEPGTVSFDGVNPAVTEIDLQKSALAQEPGADVGEGPVASFLEHAAVSLGLSRSNSERHRMEYVKYTIPN